MYIAIANARKLSNKEEEEEISGPGPDNTRTGGLRKTNKTSSEVASLFNQEVYLYSERSRFDEEGNRVASWRTGNIHTYNSSGELDIITVSDHTGKDMKNTKYTVISSDIWTDAEGWGYVQVRDKDGEIFYLPIEFLKNENKNSENGHWAVLNSGLFDGLEKYDTGGYTGEWGTDGRMAMLHEKELVLKDFKVVASENRAVFPNVDNEQEKTVATGRHFCYNE